MKWLVLLVIAGSTGCLERTVRPSIPLHTAAADLECDPALVEMTPIATAHNAFTAMGCGRWEHVLCTQPRDLSSRRFPRMVTSADIGARWDDGRCLGQGVMRFVPEEGGSAPPR
jgi:hypothetical protein